MAVKAIPEGYHTVTPYLIVEGADELLDFVREAFAADQRFRMDAPDGSVGHAEVTIGDSVVMLADASEQWPARPGSLHLYVEDCDGVYQRAVEAGATSLEEPNDKFYGDRSGCVRDPAGNVWWITTHVEDVPEEEMARRAEAWAAQQPG
jgi:PhnB protein